MVLMQESRHKRSLDFANERKVVILRDQGWAWNDIASKVINLEGESPSVRLLKTTYRDFNRKKGRRVYKYDKCGRKPWKVTAAVEAFLVRRLKALRTKCVCTATTLQREAAEKLELELEVSTIRKTLKKNGYTWRPKAQKPKLSKELMAERLRWAKAVLRLTKAALREKLSLSLDGVVWAMPPSNAVDRENFCKHGDTHMYRRADEAASPELAGVDPYPDQVKLDRALPMWGGISEGGAAVVMFHPRKKVTTQEWAKVVEAGKLTGAIQKLGPVQADGPWTVLCDNEKFLEAGASVAAYGDDVDLWHVPAASPDLNPVEKFWGWVRRELRLKDIADWVAKRPVLGKVAHKRRIRSLIESQRAQRVAKKYAGNLRSVCKEVVQKKGARARG